MLHFSFSWVKGHPLKSMLILVVILYICVFLDSSIYAIFEINTKHHSQEIIKDNNQIILSILLSGFGLLALIFAIIQMKKKSDITDILLRESGFMHFFYYGVFIFVADLIFILLISHVDVDWNRIKTNLPIMTYLFIVIQIALLLMIVLRLKLLIQDSYIIKIHQWRISTLLKQVLDENIKVEILDTFVKLIEAFIHTAKVHSSDIIKTYKSIEEKFPQKKGFVAKHFSTQILMYPYNEKYFMNQSSGFRFIILYANIITAQLEIAKENGYSDYYLYVFSKQYDLMNQLVILHKDNYSIELIYNFYDHFYNHNHFVNPINQIKKIQDPYRPKYIIEYIQAYRRFVLSIYPLQIFKRFIHRIEKTHDDSMKQLGNITPDIDDDPSIYSERVNYYDSIRKQIKISCFTIWALEIYRCMNDNSNSRKILSNLYEFVEKFERNHGLFYSEVINSIERYRIDDQEEVVLWTFLIPDIFEKHFQIKITGRDVVLMLGLVFYNLKTEEIIKIKKEHKKLVGDLIIGVQKIINNSFDNVNQICQYLQIKKTKEQLCDIASLIKIQYK